MPRILIVADDLTGANDNGALLATMGLSVATCLDPEQWDDARFPGVDALSISTDSRNLSKEEAWRRVHDGFRLLLTKGPADVLSKRVDSTLRGNVGAEIEAALAAVDESGRYQTPALAVVVPAFPTSGRVAVGGYVLVGGVALEKSAIARDPLSGISRSTFVDIIAQQTDLPIGYVPLNAALAGPGEARAAIDAHRAAGARIVACDAVTNADVAVVAEALRDAPFPVVAIDPGPFTAAMAEARVSSQARRTLRNNVLAIVGSVTELTRRQLEMLRLARVCVLPRVDCAALVDPQRRGAAIEAAVAQIVAQAGEAEVYGVCTTERADDVLKLEDVAARHGLAVHQVSERINDALAEIAERLLAYPQLRIGGLFTSGGDVSVAATRRLKAVGFSVRDEVVPLAVYSRLIGGAHPDLPMVTKGGFVGDAASIVTCVNYLITKISTQARQREKETQP